MKRKRKTVYKSWDLSHNKVMGSVGFLFASYSSELELNKLEKQKYQQVAKKNSQQKSTLLKDQERDRLT